MMGLSGSEIASFGGTELSIGVLTSTPIDPSSGVPESAPGVVSSSVVRPPQEAPNNAIASREAVQASNFVRVMV